MEDGPFDDDVIPGLAIPCRQRQVMEWPSVRLMWRMEVCETFG